MKTRFGFLDQMSDKLQGRVLKAMPKIEKDLCIDTDFGLIFLTHIFQDNHFLGFWSHSPWGRTTDGEQGWVVISQDKKVTDNIVTKTMGERVNNDFSLWRKIQKEQHGKAFKLSPEWENSLFWKISEC